MDGVVHYTTTGQRASIVAVSRQPADIRFESPAQWPDVFDLEIIVETDWIRPREKV